MIIYRISQSTILHLEYWLNKITVIIKENILNQLIFSFLILILINSCTPEEASKRLTYDEAVALTTSRPIQKQWKGTYYFNDSTVRFSNEFDGARLNGVLQTSDHEFTILIAAENYPVNSSPWYAFKINADTSTNVIIHFTYLESRNRYFPKLSYDRLLWVYADSSQVELINKGEGEKGISTVYESMKLTTTVSSENLYIAAQEVINSNDVNDWIDTLTAKNFISRIKIGTSMQHRDMPAFQISSNENTSKKDKGKALIVISRQHPPEITGYLVMKSFIGKMTDDSELSMDFRKEYTVFVAPLMNPDGVDNGHWRHNANGVDLNRDWTGFNQPETSNIKTFLKKKTEEGYDFTLGVDFHSTWQDVYYPYDSAITGGSGGLIYEWIRSIDRKLPDYHPNIKPSKTDTPSVYSRNFFYNEYGMNPLIFEIGDNTDRAFIKEKGIAAAEGLMEILTQKHH